MDIVLTMTTTTTGEDHCGDDDQDKEQAWRIVDTARHTAYNP
jgi:hypothetical protein